MTRSKVSLRLIQNESARRTTYRKRKEGLRKKMEEISVLCDVRACLLMYNPEIDGEYIWPSYDVTEDLLFRFEGLPKSEQTKKMVNHDEYMKTRVDKLKEEVIKQEIKNKNMEASILIHKISNGRGMAEIMEVREARIMIWFAEEKLQEIHKHKLLFPPQPPPPPPAQVAAQLAPPPAQPSLPPQPPMGQAHVGPEGPMEPYLVAMMNAYARRINPGDGASSSGTKDT